MYSSDFLRMSDRNHNKGREPQTDLLRAVERLLDERLQPFTKDHLDCSEACRYLNISKSTLYKKNLAKVLPYFKAGGKVYYRRADLDAYITKDGFESMEQINSRVKTYMQDSKNGR